MALLAAAAVCAAAIASRAAAQAAGDSVEYSLGTKAVVQSLYPDASWLPPGYANGYTDLMATIETYTLQSLTRDGVEGATAKASFTPGAGGAQVMVSITPANAVTRR